jgi:hypothetical protein
MKALIIQPFVFSAKEISQQTEAVPKYNTREKMHK